MNDSNPKSEVAPVAVFELTGKSSSKSYLDQFVYWFDQRSGEHQTELAEFIGHFCYAPLYAGLKSTTEKIFAFRQYLQASKADLIQSIKILRLIDEVMDFILDINHTAENSFYNREELLDELPDINSLYTIITQLPERNRKWNYTYLQWQRFKSQFSFFRNSESSFLFPGFNSKKN